MKYKGYTGVVEFDEESGTLFGHVIGLRDGITFQGDSVAEVIQAFHDSVDDYLEFCAERGESPEKPYSGQFVLRINPRLHRIMSHVAEERGVSLNSLVEEKLTFAFSQGEMAEAEPSSLVADPLEDALLVGRGGGLKGPISRTKRSAKPGKAPSRQGVRPSAAAKKSRPESGQELKVPAKPRIAKGRKG